MLLSPRSVVFIATLMVSFPLVEGQAQTAALPTPSGKHSIGKASFYWAESAHDRREVLVQVWYPAVGPSRSRASYLAGAEALASSPAAAALANLFGPSWRSITSNE